MKLCSAVVTTAALVLMAHAVSSISVCPGEGPRYGDYKCNHDQTHRVCATLKDANGNKVSWGGKDFWQLTKQSDWSSQVGSDPKNPGGEWCICMVPAIIRQR